MTPATEAEIRAVVREVVAEHWVTLDGPQADRIAAAVADALDAAGLVVMRRPAMPRAQRGRSVDHAVELHTFDDHAVLVALCGGLRPDEVDPDQLDQLDTFDPDAADACRTCRRRLPIELRPPDAAPPKRTRRRTVFDPTNYRVRAAELIAGARVELHHYPAETGVYDRAATWITDGLEPDQWPTPADVLDAAREHAHTVATGDQHQEADEHGDI